LTTDDAENPTHSFASTQPAHERFLSLRWWHSRLGSVCFLGPIELAYAGRFAVAARGTDRLLLVVGVATAAAASDVGGLLTATHGRCTFGHTLT